MFFSSDVKAELCRSRTGKKCCQLAECYGILLYSNTFTANEIRIITGSPDFAAHLPKLFKKTFGFGFDVSAEPSPGGKSSFRISDREKLRKIFAAFGVDLADALCAHVNYSILEEDCCRRAFITGAFLAGGTVSDPEKQFHFELSTCHASVAGETVPLLRELGFTPKQSKRKNSSLLYFKQSDTISDLLAMLGADITAMTIISAKIERGMRNKITSAINCDSANADKVVSAAQEQIDAIHAYAREYGLDTLPEVLHDAAILRITNPALSLSDLAKLSFPPVSKSCLAYRLRRISEYKPVDESN